MIFIPMVRLAPRGWVPNPQLTGGDTPWQTLLIPHDYWQSLGEPQSIEEYHEKLHALATGPVFNTVNFRGFQVPQEM